MHILLILFYNIFKTLTLKRQSHKMVKHTQTIRRQIAETND